MADDVQAPKAIGRYTVERLLGHGGMGRVYLARDSVLGRQVAVKVLRDDLGLPPETKAALFTRMRNEARAVAAISHAGIVTLHDMGEDESLGLFLVFEYVPGETLRERIAKGPIDLVEVARLAEELGDALEVAHQAGVIHRDVKPENVILARSGAKIADFGIARVPDSTLTQSQHVFGTPAYGAPEALATGDFSSASDQFSLAATLYEAITGARAFTGEDALAVAAKVANDDPPPLQNVAGDPRVVARVEAVLKRGLSKDKAARYASCAELGRALAKAIRDPAPSLSSQLTRTSVPPSSIPSSPGVPSEGPPSGRSAETPLRPSLVMRRRTHRVQNIVAALALIVIVGLIVFGRKRVKDDDEKDAPSPSASASLSASGSSSPRPGVIHPPRHPRRSPSASVSASASAPPAVSASAAPSAPPAATPDAG